MTDIFIHIKYTLGDWYARVPTTANPSDAPSRMCRPILSARFAPRVVVPVLPVGVEATEVL